MNTPAQYFPNNIPPDAYKRLCIQITCKDPDYEINAQSNDYRLQAFFGLYDWHFVVSGITGMQYVGIPIWLWNPTLGPDYQAIVSRFGERLKAILHSIVPNDDWAYRKLDIRLAVAPPEIKFPEPSDDASEKISCGRGVLAKLWELSEIEVRENSILWTIVRDG